MKRFFKRNNLKRNVDELRGRVEREVEDPGYVGEMINKYNADLGELQEEIDSLSSLKPQVIERGKLAIGFVSLVVLIGVVFLSIELLASDEDNAVAQKSAGNNPYPTVQADHIGNGIQTAIFDSTSGSDQPILPDIVASGTAASQSLSVIVKGNEVQPLEWYFSGSINGILRHKQTSFYADGYVYIISEENYTMGEVTQDGRVSRWIKIDKPSPDDSIGIYEFYAVEYHEATNSVYFAGGISGFDTAHHEVFRCEIQPDHKLGEWVEVNSMGTGRFGLMLRIGESPAGESYLYAISGADSNWGFLDTVEFARINSDGSLGDWSYTSSLNHSRPAADGFFHDGKLYIFGGGRHSLRNNTVEAASVRHDGHLSSWEIAGTMNDYRSCLAVAFVPQTSKVYAMGGYTGEYGQSMTNTTEVADISDLNSWKPDGSLNVVPWSLSALITPESIIVVSLSAGVGNIEYASIVTSVTGTGEDDGL